MKAMFAKKLITAAMRMSERSPRMVHTKERPFFRSVKK